MNMDILLGASEDITRDYGNAALFSLVGFVIVIATLAVLIVILMLLTKLLNIEVSKRKQTEAAIKQDAAPLDAGSANLEVVAAITAAIAAIYSEESGHTAEPVGEAEPLPFVIRSIKKI